VATTVLLLERHLVDGGRADVYAQAVEGLLDAMRSRAGCLWADAARSVGEPELALVASEWREQADLDELRASADYSTYLDVLDVCLREDPSVRRYTS
jgi:quinol monooxygenase YgiN